MISGGLFDVEFRMRDIDKNGDPLAGLNALVDWEVFREELQNVHDKKRKSAAGRKPFDPLLMLKILILQSLYNLSDDATEFQIQDRLSFMRFLGLGLGDRVPDAKTIWLFRQRLTEQNLVEPLFERFNALLQREGFAARKGQIVDASLVAAPRQRNTREENVGIKKGETPEGWSEEKARQKDTDARWAQKNGVNHYGYKNHISVDAKHKLIRHYVVTNAAVHDSQVFEELLDPGNTNREVWADSAYRSQEALERLEASGYREHLQRKGRRGHPLSGWEKQGNRTRSKTRSRVEHVFGIQSMRAAGNLVIRTIGLCRARTKIGLRNLAYNMSRYARLCSS
jgi:IS5 family transposase